GRHFLAHDGDQYFTRGIEWPHIGAGVIFLLRQPPIARRRRGRIAALTSRLEILRRAGPRITAGGDGVARLVDGADMRPDDAVDALVQDLLCDPLARLAAIGRDAHERRYRGSQRPSLQDLPA